MYSPELQAKVAVWQQKAREGTMTTEEYRQALLEMRAGRKSAAATSEASKRKKAAAVVPDAKALLATLGGLKK